MPKALDLTGQIFGNLKAISKAPSKGKKTYWLCECLLCGNQKEIQTSHIISGASQSCGCRNPVENFSKSNVIKNVFYVVKILLQILQIDSIVMTALLKGYLPQNL